MTKEQILKEFEQKFSSRSTIDLNLFSDVIEFISKTIDQTKKETREETIKEERLRASKIVEEMMEDSEYWQPIARRIISGDIFNKLKN